MAAELRRDPQLNVDLVAGSIGELRVLDGDAELYAGNSLWYPRPSTVLREVEARMA